MTSSNPEMLFDHPDPHEAFREHTAKVLSAVAAQGEAAIADAQDKPDSERNAGTVRYLDELGGGEPRATLAEDPVAPVEADGHHKISTRGGKSFPEPGDRELDPEMQRAFEIEPTPEQKRLTLANIAALRPETDERHMASLIERRGWNPKGQEAQTLRRKAMERTIGKRPI